MTITDFDDLGFFVSEFILNHNYFTSQKIAKYYIESRLGIHYHNSSKHPQLRSLSYKISMGYLRGLLEKGKIEKFSRKVYHKLS